MVALRYLIPYIVLIALQYEVAKAALAFASPFVVGVLTAGTTAAVLLVITRGKVAINRDTLLFSLFYWISGVCWLVGLDYISPAQSAILAFTMPLFSIPMAVYFLHEPATRAETYGSVIGFAGVVLFSIPLLAGALTIFGAAVTLMDALFWGLFSVFLRRLRQQDPLQTMASSSLTGTILYGGAAALDFSIRPTLALAAESVYVGVMGGVVTLFLWSALLKVERVSKLTTLVFASPIVTLAIGVAMTGVVPSYVTLIGVGLIFLGIYTSNMVGRPDATASVAAVPTPQHDS